MTRRRSLPRLWFTRRRVNHSLGNYNWPSWGLDNFYGFFFTRLRTILRLMKCLIVEIFSGTLCRLAVWESSKDWESANRERDLWLAPTWIGWKGEVSVELFPIDDAIGQNAGGHQMDDQCT